MSLSFSNSRMAFACESLKCQTSLPMTPWLHDLDFVVPSHTLSRTEAPLSLPQVQKNTHKTYWLSYMIHACMIRYISIVSNQIFHAKFRQHTILRIGEIHQRSHLVGISGPLLSPPVISVLKFESIRKPTQQNEKMYHDLWRLWTGMNNTTFWMLYYCGILCGIMVSGSRKYQENSGLPKYLCPLVTSCHWSSHQSALNCSRRVSSMIRSLPFLSKNSRRFRVFRTLLHLDLDSCHVITVLFCVPTPYSIIS